MSLSYVHTNSNNNETCNGIFNDLHVKNIVIDDNIVINGGKLLIKPCKCHDINEEIKILKDEIKRLKEEIKELKPLTDIPINRTKSSIYNKYHIREYELAKRYINCVWNDDTQYYECWN